jgi:ABC-2 type transport system permease protein
MNWRGSLAWMQASWRELLAYRTNFWMSMLSMAVIILIQIYIWLSVGQSAQLPESDVEAFIRYAILSQVLLISLPGHRSATYISKRVKSGQIFVDLLRPVGLINFLISREFGRTAGRCIFMALPVMFLFIWLYQVTGWQADWLLMSLVALIPAYFIAFSLVYLVAASSLWTGNIWGMAEIRDALILIFGGSFIPLSIYPEWLSAIASWLPFQGMYYIPLALASGLPVSTFDLLMQWGWAIGLMLLAHRVTRPLMRRAIVQGG